MMSLVCYECPPLDVARCKFQDVGFEKRGECNNMRLGLYGVVERHKNQILAQWKEEDTGKFDL